MSFRLLTTRSTARALRQPVPRQLVRSSIRRGYASKPIENLAQSSDMPWLLGSVTVTAVGLYFILPSGPKKTAAHGEPEHKAEEVSEASEAPEGEEANEAPKAEGGEETGQGSSQTGPTSSQTGQDVPPPPSDNTSLAENTEEKKEQHEEYKETHDTKVATSSSDLPSKKAAMEHPREDPQKGEGEAKQKGGSAEDEAK